MKKLLAVSILACLTIALVYATAFAQGEEVLIKPYAWDNRTVYSDQFIYLDARWGACRKGLIQSFMTATNISWTLEEGGVEIASGEDTNRFWGPIQQITPSTASCVGKTPDTIPVTYWNYPVGNLDAGDYILHFVWWFDHPILDGGDYDGVPGPDIFKGTLFDLEISIHVEDR